MTRKIFIILCLCLLVAPLMAQDRTGNIKGIVVDEDGNPLPGVTVTLTGVKTAGVSVVTSAEGAFRFMYLPPSKDYTIKLELEGFKTRIDTGVFVVVGRSMDLLLTMEMGMIEEEVTVIAKSPIVDVKKTSLTHYADREVLQSLPTARDPWVFLQMVPSIQVDRENIGGNESGQQASFVALGGDGDQDTWSMDGINITDPAASGASPTYYDYDVFEEINVTVGGMDVETHTGGVALNMVTRRGGNKVSFGGRFYYTQKAFQSMPKAGDLYDELKDIFGEDYGYNQIRDIKDFGFNIGGPLWKDKIWWWMSYGVQEIKTRVINGSKDDTYLNNYAFKLNIQPIPENRIELFAHLGDKRKFGRSSSTSFPSGYNQRGKYEFGSPILKIQDEHMFGNNFFVNAKIGFTDAGFGLWPANDMDLKGLRTYDYTERLWTNSYYWFMTSRPNLQGTLHATYFNDDLLGGSHEIKMGVEYIHRKDSWVSGSPGNIRLYKRFTGKTVDWDLDGDRDWVLGDFGIDLRRIHLYRGTTDAGPEGTRHMSAFLADTMSFGRFTLKAGVRWDRQQSYTKGGQYDTLFLTDSTAQYFENYYEIQQKFFGTGVAAEIARIFPGTVIPEVALADTVPWNFISPRLGMTWDVTGDGRTIAKASVAMYGGRMSSWPAYLWQRGGSGGWMRFYWHDADGNMVADFDELYWADYSTSARPAYKAFDANGKFIGDYAGEENQMWGGYDFENPDKTTAPWYNVDPNWHEEKTLEAILTLEREVLPDLAIGADFTWRKYNGWWTNWDYSDTFGGTLLATTDFVAMPTPVPQTYTAPDGTVVDLGDAAGRNWYGWKAGVKDVYGWYATNTPDDYYDIYIGADIRVQKRMSNGWMLNMSATWQDQRNYWGATYPLNPTNKWSADGNIYAYDIGGGSGKMSMNVFSRYMFKAQGLFQLPWDFDVSFTFNAREGHIVPNSIGLSDENAPNPLDQSGSIHTKKYGTDRMPFFYNLNLRLQKIVKVGDVGRIYLMVDGFNILNNTVLNRKRDVSPGTIYLDDLTFSKNTRSGEPNELLNPRVFRFGLRFQF